jgi:hypothetical protein
MERETGYEVERELAAAFGAGLCEAVGVGAGLDDVAAEGEAVHDGGAEAGSVNVLVQPLKDSLDAIAVLP